MAASGGGGESTEGLGGSGVTRHDTNDGHPPQTSVLRRRTYTAKSEPRSTRDLGD